LLLSIESRNQLLELVFFVESNNDELEKCSIEFKSCKLFILVRKILSEQINKSGCIEG
jgi:hypothetical protein